MCLYWISIGAKWLTRVPHSHIPPRKEKQIYKKNFKKIKIKRKRKEGLKLKWANWLLCGKKLK